MQNNNIRCTHIMYPRIIAITGMKRSGKDTIADYLAKQHGYHKIKISFPIKQICKNVFDFTDEQLESDAKDVIDKNWGISPRHAMQFIGTEIFQHKINELVNVGKELWIKKTVLLIEQSQAPVVISDLRFQHEHKLLKDLYKDQCIIIQTSRRTNLTQDNHVSEQEWDSFPADCHINNNSGLSDLYIRIDTMLKSFKN